MFKNLDMNNFSTTLPSKNTENSQKIQYKDNRLDQNNEHLIKSTTFV